MADSAPTSPTPDADCAPTLTDCADGCCGPATRDRRQRPTASGPATSRPDIRRPQQVLVRRVRYLVAATIGYNVIEAVVAITAGTAASSTALIGFGLDS